MNDARRAGVVRRLVLIGVLLAVLAASALLWPRPQPGALAVPGDRVLVTGAPGAVGRIPGCPGEARIWTAAAVALP